MIDSLTGLPDRRASIGLVERELHRRIPSSFPLAIILLDVNDFRGVNDRLGHLGGDEVLRQFGQSLAVAVRPRNYVGRFGGDLFMVVAPETDSSEAEVLGEEIRSAVEGASYAFEGSQIKLQIRLGIAVAEAGENPTFEELNEEASEAMDEEGRRQRIS